MVSPITDIFIAAFIIFLAAATGAVLCRPKLHVDIGLAFTQSFSDFTRGLGRSAERLLEKARPEKSRIPITQQGRKMTIFYAICQCDYHFRRLRHENILPASGTLSATGSENGKERSPCRRPK
jgi:hypothetical protein